MAKDEKSETQENKKEEVPRKKGKMYGDPLIIVE